MLLGLRGILTHEAAEEDAQVGQMATYRGWSAILVGVPWILLGVAVLITAIAFGLGLQQALFRWILNYPGPAPVLLGVTSAAYAGHALLGSEE